MFSVLLAFIFCTSMWRWGSAMRLQDLKTAESAAVSAQVASNAQAPCLTVSTDLEIPDDGTWLQICLIDPSVPDQSTITDVRVKYVLDHPDPRQLEIRLARASDTASQTLWDRGKAVKSATLGEATALDAFHGRPAQGEWQFLVRDVVPGQKGLLKAVSVRAYYAPVGPLPQVLAGTPGRPTSFRIPPGTTPSNSPDKDGQKAASSPSAVPQQTSGWQQFTSETFEGLFPNAGWALSDVKPNDGKEYLWDDDDFRPHNGRWAAWPANGGVDGLDPTSATYPPNMGSWMIYGPFDLSDAKTAETSFWL